MERKPLILIVEDEKEIAKFIDLELQAENYETVVSYDGVTGLSKFRELNPDLVVLDLMLPVLDGLEVARRIRKTSNTPIIILTAKDSVDDKVTGLDSGADDYLVKPFSHAELVARLRALLRRSGVRRARALGDLEVDDDAGEARLRGERLDLTRREFELLACLVANAGRVLSRGELLDKVWGVEFSGTERTVDQHVAQLRARLGPGWIETVRGRGYRMSRAGGDR